MVAASIHTSTIAPFSIFTSMVRSLGPNQLHNNNLCKVRNQLFSNKFLLSAHLTPSNSLPLLGLQLPEAAHIHRLHDGHDRCRVGGLAGGYFCEPGGESKEEVARTFAVDLVGCLQRPLGECRVLCGQQGMPPKKKCGKALPGCARVLFSPTPIFGALSFRF